MAKSTYHRIPAEFKYAKVFEHNRDMGNGDNVDHSDIDGQYQLVAVISEETKDEMVRWGVPESAMGWQQFKPAEDGRFEYRFKRPHKSKYMKNDDGSQVVLGPPEVIDLPASQERMEAEGGSKLWEHLVQWPSDELIGNGSSGYVKFSLYKGAKGKTIITLESVAVENHVPFESDGDGSGPAF
jgi:hypothetical protein